MDPGGSSFSAFWVCCLTLLPWPRDAPGPTGNYLLAGWLQLASAWLARYLLFPEVLAAQGQGFGVLPFLQNFHVHALSVGGHDWGTEPVLGYRAVVQARKKSSQLFCYGEEFHLGSQIGA